MAGDDELRQARADIEDLRRDLAEARDTLRAIRSGEVDALVVETPEGEHLFTLESAYEPYRVFVESMQQGAASLSPEGLVLYSNPRFAEILGLEDGAEVGQSIYGLLDETRRPILQSLLAATPSEPADGEMELRVSDGRRVHALFHVTAMPDGTRCVVVTDLTERVRQAEILASREWLRVTLASIAEGVLCGDAGGRLTFLNPAAERLTGLRESDALGLPLTRAFRVVDERTHEPIDSLPTAVLREGRVVEMGGPAALVMADGREMPIEATAAPMRDEGGALAGVVIVFHDATEKRRAQDAIRESEARLAEANRAKDEFLATLSHELRTPVTAIVGWAHMLVRGNLDEATSTRGLHAILRNAQAQVQLVTDILDVSRIVSGKLRLDVRRLDLAAVVYAAIDSIRPAAEAKGISLVSSVAVTSTTVSGDAERLQQVVWNLLSNAVKFTPAGGTVEVSLRQTGTEFQIAVSDSGTGIRRDFLPRIFERFAQADSSTRRQHGGLGLGLSIVRHLVELHGGTIEGESEGDGKGSRFTVRLPARAPAQADATPSPDATPLAAAEAATAALDGIRVLVVDDEADTRDMLATLLGGCGAEVRLAASAGEGIRELTSCACDVVLADIGMPGEDGYEFIARVRALPGGGQRGVPAIALTAYGRSEDAARALSAGFQMHLAKPVAARELTSRILQLARRPPHASGGGERARAAAPPPGGTSA